MSNKDYIRKNAIIYERYKDNLNEIDLNDIHIFREEVYNAYMNVQTGVEYVSGQPYASLEELSYDIAKGNRLQISKDNNESELLPGIWNLRFRAVHDYIHYLIQAPFTASGEIKVYEYQKKFHGEGVRQKILFSEVVLQACYAEYFGKFPDKQKVIINV